jgi:DNA repair exonuclease SbcCD ATPase subunit
MSDQQIPNGFDVMKLWIKGFISYSNDAPIVFDFTSKFTAITGPTGSGKTTTLDAITFALFSKCMRTDARMKIEDIMQPGGHVAVEFAKNGNVYVVKRGRATDGSSILEMKVNNERFHGNVKAINAEIERVMGMTYDAFISSSIIRQKEITMFSTMTPSDRLATLQSLFQLQIFEKALERAKAEKKRIERDVSILKGEVDGLKRLVDDENELKKTLEEKKSIISESMKRKKTLESKIEQVSKDLDAMRKDKEEVSGMSAKVDEMKKTLATVEQEITTKTDRVAKIQEEMRNDESITAKSASFLKMKQDATEIEKLRNDRNALQQSIESREKYASDQAQKYAGLLSKYSGGISIDEYTEIAKKVGAAESYANLADPVSVKNLSKIKKELEQKKKSCISGVVHEVLSKEITINDADEGSKDRMATIDASIGMIENRLDGMSASDIDREIESIKQSETMIQVKKNELKEKRDAIIQANTIKSLLTGEIDQHEKLIIGKKESLAVYDIKDDLAKKMNESLIKATQEIAEATGTANTIKASLSKIDECRKVMDTDGIKIKDMENDLVIIDYIVENVLHNRGITMFAVETVLGSIELRASEILNYMTSGKFSLIKFARVQAKNSYGFDIIVDEKPVAGLSGGQQTQVNASIRFAIAEKLSEMTEMGAEMKTLFIDEGDIGSLDSETSRQRFMDAVVMLVEKYFNKGIVITHMPELVDSFDKKIRIEQDTAGFSRVVAT